MGFCFACGLYWDLAPWFLTTLLVNEASTPLLHLLWYLQHRGLKDKPIYIGTGAVLVVVFFVCRILFIPYTFYMYVLLNQCHGYSGFLGFLFFVITPFYGVIYILNLVW